MHKSVFSAYFFARGFDNTNLAQVLEIPSLSAFFFVIWSGAGEGDPVSGPTLRTMSPVINFRNQLSYIAGSNSEPVKSKKLMPSVSICDLRPADGAEINKIIKNRMYRGIGVCKNGADLGGACSATVNRAMSCLTSGKLPSGHSCL